MTSSSIQRTVYPDGLIRMQTFAERVAPYLMKLIVRTSKRALFATAV
jgi:hypothetical protein